MKTAKNLFSFFVLFLFVVLYPALDVEAVGYPHYLQNGLSCSSCHDVYNSEPKLMPPWTSEQEPQNIDDLQFNKLCWSCHNELNGSAPYVVTHSSLQADDSYGHWTVECRVCHEPHFQLQAKTYTSDYVEVGFSTAIGPITLTKDSAGWNENEFEGMILIPNKNYIDFSYKIIGNTSDTITVDPGVTEGETETMNLALAHAGDPFVVSYGKLIRNQIDRSRILEYENGSDTWDPSDPNINSRTGTPAVKLIRPEGDNSFADSDSTYDGVCQVCHAQTNHFRNTGEVNVTSGGYDHTDAVGTYCIRCHNHENGFMHGSGSEGCVQCHGHDAGSKYDPDMSYPPELELGTASIGAGSSWSHSTHTEFDDDDKVGPQIYCDICHDTSNMPLFKNLDGSGGHSLEETDICNNCHSPGGTYNGVNSTGDSIGAKDNWHTGVYDEGRNLQVGKEKWCAGCHDEEPSTSWWDGSGVYAPKVIGDESGSYTYGTGWGFYKTGHGLASAATYPASGGIYKGAGKECADCHDYSNPHIDHKSRSFDCTNTEGSESSAECDPDEYREDYRLQMVNGHNPMTIPLPNNTAPNPYNYMLCFGSAGCHLPDKYLSTSTDLETVFRDDVGDQPTAKYKGIPLPPPINAHEYHLNWAYGMNNRAAADWRSDSSVITCIICHNVHGSTNLAMIRNGKLVDREPGLEILYTEIDADSTSSNPTPADLTLDASVGTFWDANTPETICSDCHGNGPGGLIYRRSPPVAQQAPTLSWADDSGYITDGADPDSGEPGTVFQFKVKFADVNHDLPTSIQVWLDLDGGGYGDDEKYDLWEVDFSDQDTEDGKLYRRTIEVNAAPGTYNYRFYARDRYADATGDPVTGGTITVTAVANPAPLLEWTGEPEYVSDGVDPGYAVSGSTYTFRVKYTDDSAAGPNVKQIWVDLDDSGTFDAGEKLDMTAEGGTPDTGEIFSADMVITYPAEPTYGRLKYQFYFEDDEGAVAYGKPTSPLILTVGEPCSITVCASGCDFTEISAAVYDGGTINGDVICVDDGTYDDWAFVGKKITVQSMHGPENTIVDIAGTSDVVAFNEYDGSSSDATLRGITIRNGSGKGITITNSKAVILDSIIEDNGTGGIYTVNGSADPVVIEGTSIRNNNGPGIYNVNIGFVATIVDTVFAGNYAAGEGAAVYAGAANTYTFERCEFSGNQATGNGGAVRTGIGTYTFTNCIFSGNYSGNYGGAVYSNYSDSGGVTFTNCTFAGNSAEYGGGIYSNLILVHLKVHNSILWGNEARSSENDQFDGVIDADPGSIYYAEVKFTDIGLDQRYSVFTNQEGNIYFDPQFVDPVPASSAPTTAGDYHLLITSPVIDQASATYAPDDDVDTEVRPNPDSSLDDMGADEYYYNPSLDLNETSTHTAEAYAEGGSAITISMPYGKDANGNNTYTVDYNCSTTGSGNLVTDAGHTESPYTNTLTGLTPGETCTVTMTYTDPDGVAGENPQTVSSILVPYNETTVGGALAEADGLGGILVTVPYTGDENDDNTYMVKYKLSSAEDKTANWTTWISGPDHEDSPYTTTISSLASGSYDVRVTYYDPDGVIGTNPQAIEGIVVNNNQTSVGTASALFAGGTSIDVTMPYTYDENDTNTFEVSYSCDTVSGGPIAGDSTYPDPYTTTITGLVAGETCSVTMTYIDGDGVNGVNPQTVSGIIVSDNATMAETASATAAGDYSIDVSMLYSYDTGIGNTENAYTVDYDCTTTGTGTINGSHTASPYTTAITGLSPGETCDVTMTYNDVDGVNGIAVQTVTGIELTYNSTTVGTAEATAEDETSIVVFMPYTGDADENNTYSIRYDDGGGWSTPESYAHSANPFSTTIAGLTPGTSYQVEMTYIDDYVNGTNPQTVSVYTPDYETTVGSATAVAGYNNESIVVEMPYTFDDNEDNTYTVDYVCTVTGSGNWVTEDTHTDSAYTTTITGLTPGETCDVTMTYNDADGVNGTNPQTVNVAIPGGAAPDYTVGCGAGGGAGTPPDYDTINEAIAVASEGDIIEVCDGTYSENVNFNGKDITIQSQNGAAFTTIEGDGSNAAVVTFSNSETSAAVLDGFTINNQRDTGANHGNGGIRITGGAAPVIKNSTIIGNDLTAWSANGAGIYFNASGAATIFNCIIGTSGTPNLGALGVGMYILDSTGITVTDSYITYNTGTNGGGVYIDDSTVTFNNTHIDSNTITQSGGGMRLEGSTTDVTINGGTVSSNIGDDGAGITVNTGASLTVNNSEINNNSGSATTHGVGGGLYVIGTSTYVELNSTLVQGNATEQAGGGIFINDSSATVTMSNCIITGNTTDVASVETWHKGGGVCNGGLGAPPGSAGGTLNFYNTTISGNYAGSGGGLYTNTNTGLTGPTTVRNSIIWGNNASSNPDYYGTFSTAEFSDIGGYTDDGTHGNLDSDPQFVDFDPAGKATSGTPSSTGNFQLTSSSPCIDAGMNDSNVTVPADDYWGDSRPQDGTAEMRGDGSDYDIGADEYVP